MLKKSIAFVGCLLLPFAFAVVGCGTSATPSAAPEKAASTEPAHTDHDHGKGVANDAGVDAEFAKLSPADRTLATKQRICAVSGEPLGSMGAPIKVEVKGQQVFICCESCREPLLAEPDKHLAKLNK